MRHPIPSASPSTSWAYGGIDNDGIVKKKGVPWEAPLQLPPEPTISNQNSSCPGESPRIFHIYWAGAFTDKPYVSILSFLFTQNVALHRAPDLASDACRPQLWLWINPGPAASIPNPGALADMENELASNLWAAPFLHPRFKDIIKFKLWNTTEQLDGVAELRGEWRQRELFYSNARRIASRPWNAHNPSNNTRNNSMLGRAGSKSSASYDKLSAILSDMARFVLVHSYGGIYLDADTIFLRDWEELWGWRGAFAYRWSRLPRYNTAVLKMNKNSALGAFIFKTALQNGMDFHPMAIARYMKDAHLTPLLLRLPDALFDSAWLNTENYQTDRPPQPFFTRLAS